MTPNSLTLALSLAAAMLAAGCATASGTDSAPIASAAMTCSQLGSAIADAEGTKAAAQQKEQDAWKAVVPFAVAARYASGKSAAADADTRLAELRAESDRQGCSRHVD